MNFEYYKIKNDNYYFTPALALLKQENSIHFTLVIWKYQFSLVF